MAVTRCERISLQQIHEQHGSLCVAEVGRHVPFKIERAYWIFGVPTGGERGQHAHREQSELLIPVRGSFIVSCDDGKRKTVYTLDSPGEALLLGPMVFHRLDDFRPGSVCLVFASGPYDPSEYITDYDEFRALIVRR